METKVTFKREKIYNKLTKKSFGQTVSVQWKKLLNPYTPRDTGALMNNVDKLPFELHYKQSYAKYVYLARYAANKTFQKKNPYATYEWDIKAANAGQLNKLYQKLNERLDKHRVE